MGLILIVIVVGLAVWLLTQNRETGKSLFANPVVAEGETPLEILSKRYACGEIDREEFEARKRDLS